MSRHLFPSAEVGDRFATHVGVRVAGPDHGSASGCGATATLAERPWLAGPTDDPLGPAPTGALLALVDATARHAARAALGPAGAGAAIEPTATSVQHHRPARGDLSASADVPCEGALADRADEHGVLRFSVAVAVVDAGGDRVATGTVQWRARLDGTRPPASVA